MNKQQETNIALLESSYRTEFCYINGYYYPAFDKPFGQDRCVFRFTDEQVEAERFNRDMYNVDINK